MRHATLSGATLSGEPRVRHGTLSSEHRPGTIVSSKVEDDDSGVDPEEGSDQISLSCLVRELSRTFLEHVVYYSIRYAVHDTVYTVQCTWCKVTDTKSVLISP